MNRYWDLSEQDRAELTYEQIEAMLTVELMEQGVVKVEPPTLEPVDDVKLEKDTFYQVLHEGSYSDSPFDCLFSSVADAQTFIDLKPMWSHYDYNVGNAYTHAKYAGQMKIAPVQLCREQDVLNVKARLEASAATKKANEKLTADYNAARKKINDATSGVWQDWRDCRDKQRDCQKVIDTLKEYTGLCDGNDQQAKRFLAKAFNAEEIRTAMEWFGLSNEVEVFEAVEL